MPSAWLQWLQESNISPRERRQNPELVLEVLQCYDAATQGALQQKFMTQHETWSRFLFSSSLSSVCKNVPPLYVNICIHSLED
ncbi:unnamed protein product [Schistocephalus solidus]|uniref:Uncharacterized protein n=1 Tax=Schistocephalus solidus TaxID=70667 RepID=A0A183TJS4_SCHSO|nr:unnamed protein product [Schistocephalus solidus]